ncbi:class I SAM-dependent methyltransferase [Mycobacterium sp. 050272]|uniref:class I SAM-dependent methyltransferase n=1 Tax=Mycobacterium sp. 050272 TaxID=3142488 RepID=UPI00318E6915
MTAKGISQCVRKYWEKRNSVPGAFWDIDFLLFDQIFSMQLHHDIRGDLLEIGALYGKSAIVLGCHARLEEKVIICDIFNDTEGDIENIAENAQTYGGLSRKKFEENYSQWVARPPVVLAELSEHLIDRVEAKTLRFVHIDGSHLYNVVCRDIADTRGLMTDNGVVVMDDFRAIHTPGVAAAVWEAVSNHGLIPICISEQKFYGAWNPDTARSTREYLTRWLASQGEAVNYGIQDVAGTSLLIIQNPPPLGGKSQIVIKISNPWTPITIVLAVPAFWRRHFAAPRLRDVLTYAWIRHHLGSRPVVTPNDQDLSIQ